MQALWNLIFGPGWLATLATYITITTAILVAGSIGMMLFTWIERRGIAYMQDRKGPNRVGPFGLFQPISEAIKTMTKEDITPVGADRWVHFLAPVVIMFATLMAFAVIPWGNLIPSDINVGVLFIFSVSALHTLGILMAGWGSNNKFALLGGMRGVAQAISYEIPQLTSLVPIIMIVGSMSVVDVVQSQSGFFGLGWHLFTPVGLLGFIIFWISSLAEGERTPFDIPEAESELVAGHMTEYSGMKFALFYLANYMTLLVVCAATTAMFLGGGNGPGSNLPLIGTPISIVYFLIKTVGLFFVMVWIRGAIPRLRVDQLMSFAWKFLLPLALINVFSASLWVAIVNWTAEQGVGFLEILGQPGGIARYAVAWAVTGAINLIAFILVIRLNSQRDVTSYQPAATAA